MSQKTLLALAAAAVQCLSGVVDGYISMEYEVECLPEAPSLCVGSKVVYGPSPSIICDDPTDFEKCETIYSGGYGWEYSFVEGLDEGTTDCAEIDAAKTGFTVAVTIEDDGVTCEVSVGDFRCTSCSAEGCRGIEAGVTPSEVKFDCTNLPNGRASLDTCVALEDPFLYPFKIEDESMMDEKEDPWKDEPPSDIFDAVAVETPSSANSVVPRGILFAGTMASLLLAGIL